MLNYNKCHTHLSHLFYDRKLKICKFLIKKSYLSVSYSSLNWPMNYVVYKLSLY